MDFISWSVFGVLLMLAEFGVGKFYLLAIGLAFLYPAIAAFANASIVIQLGSLMLGGSVHLLIRKQLFKRAPSPQTVNEDALEGQLVDVIEWIDESTARVKYRDEEWQAEKVDDSMPCSSQGTILKVQYGRLIIATEPAAQQQDEAQ